MKKEPSPFGKMLKDARRRRGLSQEDVARAIGVSRPTVAMVETGASRAIETKGALQKLSSLFAGDDPAASYEYWKALADRSQQSFLLQADDFSDEQRETAALLAEHFAQLPSAVLRAIRQTIKSHLKA